MKKNTIEGFECATIQNLEKISGGYYYRDTNGGNDQDLVTESTDKGGGCEYFSGTVCTDETYDCSGYDS